MNNTHPPASGNRTRNLVSCLILVAIGLQIVAIGLRTGPWAWPFTNYPMYASAHYENERIEARYQIYAIFEDGREKLLEDEDAGSLHWFYQNWAKAMVAYDEDYYVLGSGGIQGEPTGSALRARLKKIVSRSAVSGKYIDAFTKAAERNLGETIVALRVEDFPAIITRDGWVEAPPAIVLKELEIARSQQLARDE